DAAGLFPVTPRDRVHPRREPDGRDGHVKPIVIDHRMMPESDEGFAADAHLLPHRTDALLDLLDRERIMPGRHGRVGGERARRAHQAPTLTWRPDSCTVARQGSPFGPRTGWSGVAATWNRSSASSCQPSSRSRWSEYPLV